MRYEDASGAFQASGPIANDDSDTLPAGSKQPATGNLITGEGTQYGSSGADSAAGGHITSIAGKGGEDSSFAGGRLSVTGEHGSLSVDAEGNYRYVANKDAPENVRDRFTYTLADNQGNTDTAALIVELGKTPAVIKADAQQIVPGPDGVVTLPPGVDLSDVMVVGRNLVINMPDGTQLIIIDGAVFVPQLVLDGVQVPATNVAALLIGQEPQPAAGELPPSSGGNFALPPPPLDPGVPLGDLIPPMEDIYVPPEPQETFNPEDDKPVNFGNIDILIDDDTLPGGLAGGPGDGPDAVNIAGFLAAISNLGGDPPLTFSLELTTAPAGFALVSGGPGILLLQQNGTTVRTLTFDPATGEYDLTQNARILHPAGGEENDLTFILTVTVTDADGDTAFGTITITYDDDTPGTTQVQVGGTVDEDGVPGGIPGGTGDVLGEATIVNGSVVGLFLPGADGPLTYGLSSNTSGLPALTSNGVAVTYAVAGNTLTASAGGNTVFTLIVNANGNFTFTLVDQIDHPTLNGQAGDNTENDLSLALGSIVQATDADGDSVNGQPNGLVIVVDDDTPVALQEGSSTGTVDEDGVPGGIAGGVGDVAGAATVANGSIASLFASGADAPLTFGLLSDTSGLASLTSNGVAVTYVVAGNTLTASAGGNSVFTLVLNANGSWTFTLLDQLDHADGLDENDLTLDFSSILQATDADGDSVGANPRALVITVDDDTPAPSGNTSTGTVDEDGVPGGIAGGPGDVAGESAVATGNASALFNSGADAPLSFAMSTDTSGLPALTSNGVAVTYAVVGNTLTASAGGNPVFTFVLNANGSWTFTLLDQLDHATLNGLAGDNTENDLSIDLSSLVLAVDADEDPISAGEGALIITVDDDTPTANGNQVTGTVDEDGVLEGAANNGPGDGIAGGTGDVAGAATVANGSVATVFNSGADQPLSFGLLTDTSGLPALTSGGVVVTYSVVGNTLTASAGGNPVFTFVLNADGSFTFTLVDQIDHPTLNGAAGDDTENDLSIDLSSVISATDADGDSVNANAGALVITVDDDTPIATAAQVTGTVDEDGVLEGAADNGPGDGIAGGVGDVAGAATVANGSVAELFQSGADEALTYSLLANTAGLPALTSGGVAVTYSVAGNTLTASAGGNPVFTFVLNADGSFTFTLVDQIDHPTLNGAPGDNEENDLSIDLSSVISATDADGDSVNANAGGLVITVDDDTPIATQNQVTGTVDEDGVLEGAADSGPGDGIAGGTGDVAGQAVVANGSVATLFQSGADEALTYSLLANTSGLPALTSGGVAVTYSVVGNTLTASAGGSPVFTFVLNADGSWTFTLVDQLDHPTLNGLAGDNTENDLGIALGSIIQATDADGDSVTANANGLVITVDDDTPTATGASVGGTVDEDGVVEAGTDGDGIAGGPGDVAGEATVANGSITTLFNSGADEPLAYSLSPNTAGLPALTSHGVAVTYSVVGNLLTASAGGETVFTLSLNSTTGAWTFTLVDQIDHPTLNGLPGDDTENDLSIDLSSILVATDFDGDSVTANAGGLVIVVDDDTPVARNDTDSIVSGGDITIGNVITGTGTDSGAAGADSTGADAPVSITGLVGAVSSDTNPVGGFVASGNHGVLTMQADGSYSYDRNDGGAGNVQDTFTYTLTDADGDSVTATLVITISDAAPVLTTPPPILVDDDDVPGEGGNPGGVGDDAPTATSGNLVANGGDGDIDYFMSALQTMPAGFTSNLVSGAGTQTLTISQTGVGVVLTIVLTNETGAYTVTQNNPIQHASLDGLAGDNTENNAGPFNVSLFAQDNDGDQSPAVNLVITVDDDTPVVTTAQVTGDVDEDDVPGGIDGGPGDASLPQPENVDTGSVAALFSAGADNPLTYSLLTNTSGLPALTSGGVAVTYAVIGNTLTASAGGNPVFTFVLDANTGNWTFTLLDQLDHATLNGLAGDNSENELTIQLGSIIQATDTDGDSVTASSAVGQGLLITVDDDTPTATTAQVTGDVDEDDVVENVAVGVQKGDGIDGGPGDASLPQPENVDTGSVTSLFNSGADQPLTFSLSTITSGLPALTSGGVAVTYAVVGNTLTASAGGNPVFTFVLQSNGDWTFTLLDQLDHATLNGLTGDNTENELTIQLGSIIQATDRDGDTVTANSGAGQGLLITVDDDSPKINTVVTPLQIDNDDTPSGSGAFDFDIGADENSDNDDITVSNFTVLVNGEPVTESLVPVSEDATTASYTFSFQYETGTGGTATAQGTLVFDKMAGTYTVELTNGPIEGFSLLSTGAADASDFVSYQVPDGGSGAAEVTVAALDTDFFVQFSGVAEPGSGTGTNNLTTTTGAGGAFVPVTTASFAGLELFTQDIATIQVSNTAAGVAGNTIQGGEVLDLNLYATDPMGTLGGIPTQSSTSMFMTLDGIGGSEDMIVILKLYDTSTGQYTTKAVIVQNADILTDDDAASLVGTPYEGLGAALDNNDGLIVIEANDYQEGNTNLVIVGAQIAGSDEGITGTGINLNGDVDLGGGEGGSSGTQTFDTDVSDAPFKITSIGFLTTSTEDQNAQIDFDVTLEDADGDAITQHITVNIGDPLGGAAVTSFSSQEEQIQKTAANSNTLTLAAAVGAAGLADAAAAESSEVDSADGPVSNDAATYTTQVVEAMSVDDDAGDAAVSAFAAETSGEETQVDSSNSRASDDSKSGGNLDDGSANAASDSGDASASDAGSDHGSADAAPPAAPTVAMVSAEALESVAKVHSNGNVQQGGAVEQIVADALGHGGAPTVDGLLAHLPGEIGELAAIAKMASPADGDVSTWHSAPQGAVGAGFDMMFKMDVAMHHQDAVQPVANG